MTGTQADRRLLGLLESAEAASPVDAVQAVTGALAQALGATRVAFLLADLSGRALVRLTQTTTDPAGQADTTTAMTARTAGQHGGVADTDAVGGAGGPVRRDGTDAARVLSFDNGVMERVLREQAVSCEQVPEGWRVLAPVTERGEALGLLELLLPAEPDGRALAEVAGTAHALAFVVIANRRHTDLFEWGARTTGLSLAAEIQRRLLPLAFTCEAAAFTLAGWLEPAASVAGDTFDYSLDRRALHLSMTDAMGHGVDSALLATLCVGSLRNSRRQGLGLVEAVSRANTDTAEHAANTEGFATGLVARLDLASGVLSAVNAGHVAPLLVRDGQVQEIELPADLPLGMLAGSAYRVSEVALAPGDRLVLVTDGMLERNAEQLDLSEHLLASRPDHPREAVRQLCDAVVAVAGPVLADDATLLILDWHGGDRPARQSSAGADLPADPAGLGDAASAATAGTARDGDGPAGRAATQGHR